MTTVERYRGMPPLVRAAALVHDRVLNRDISRLTPDRLAARRGALPAPRPLGTWVAGRVDRSTDISTVPVEGRDGVAIPTRVIRPPAAGPDAPVVLYLHGGGFMLSGPAVYDPLTTHLARTLGAVVVAPDYRKAPEHPAPVAAHDCHDVLGWVLSRPASLGAGGPVAVAGDSAGGNLSAVICLLARDTGGPQPVGQALIYPATDLTRSQPSARWRHAPLLPGSHLDVYLRSYLAGGVEATDPVVSPLLAERHDGLPPALVQTAEHDPLRDEGERYAQMLREAGVPVRLTRYVGMPHGFLSVPGLTPMALQARSELAASLRGWLEDAR